MASYNQVQKGSSGKDVKTLQELLNKNGASLDVDGVFGDKTLAAVKAYQKANGLDVDGIVGTNTWGKLTTPASTATQTTAQPEVKAPTFEYTKSDAVLQAEDLLQQHMANKPGDFQYSQQAAWDEIMNKINNREKFSYDLNGDMLYQQYKDQYTTQGKLGMMDTMGQAAAMTGGYGNSYAQTAGQQTYQGYLQQLNDKVPELYQLALNQYNQETDDLYNQYGLYSDQYQNEYGEYRDMKSDYYTDLANLKDDARYMSETEYNQALQDFNIKYSSYWDQTNFDYQKDRDAVADAQWQATFDEGVRQYNASLAEQKRQADNKLAWEKEEAAAKKQEEWDKEVKAAAKSDDVKSFRTKMDDDTKYWDAVMRHKYGSEKTYIAQQIENSKLTDAEKAYLISYYGITENDLNYKK